MEAEYLRKFLALGLAGVRTPDRRLVWQVGSSGVFKAAWHQATTLFNGTR